MRYIFILLIFFVSCRNNEEGNRIIRLDHYPSASAIDYNDGKFYVIGDDATYLLILDENLKAVDSISLYQGTEKRLDKETKPDLESITVTDTGILIYGSGSLLPYRNVGWNLDPKTKKSTQFQWSTIYFSALLGYKEINIEGLADIPDYLVFANRGHQANRFNELIFRTDDSLHYAIVDVASSDTSLFSGISGLAYARESDALIMSASTEDTKSTYEDGAIGKSYLWIIDSISRKIHSRRIQPSRVIDLETIDISFKGQKIESVCVIKETNGSLYLGLAADNDDGSSTLFLINLPKK